MQGFNNKLPESFAAAAVGSIFSTDCVAIVFRFTAWPDDALQSTAENFLADVDMSDELRKSAGAMCMQFHSGVRTLTTRYAAEAKRHFYITPTSYLQLLNAYKTLYAKKNYEVSSAKRRYENGLEKLLFTEEQVTSFCIQLIVICIVV